MNSVRYILISPVKDEARFIEKTLHSVIRQTLKPYLWIIVDDGSSDSTPDIIRRFQAEHNFVHILTSPSAGARQPGSGVIRAFNLGYNSIKDLAFDFIVKLDCDLSFNPDYFEKLIMAFHANPRLGIASGVYEETKDGKTWRTIPMPFYHAAGASKVIRRECFEQIGGFISARGWDTVDEIRAHSLGWTTGHFETMKMKHHKPEGAGIGQFRTAVMHGQIYYLTGGGLLFFILKVFNRMMGMPLIIGGLAMFWGYTSTFLSGRPRLVTHNEAGRYRRLLNRRLFSYILRLHQ